MEAYFPPNHVFPLRERGWSILGKLSNNPELVAILRILEMGFFVLDFRKFVKSVNTFY
jgi:hypothetical protein